MKIAHVLSPKGRLAVTIPPSAPIGGAAQKMVEYRIGYLIVCDESGTVVGVLSERDIVRGIAERGKDSLDNVVQDLMTANPVTCTLHDEAWQVLRAMNTRGFRHMPVVEKEKLKGIVSSRDIIQHLLGQANGDIATLTTLHELGVY